jgi:hypothetical protein
MADAIHRTSRDSNGCLLRVYSINTPDYSTDDWLINPDLSGVSGIDCWYWKVTGTPPSGTVEEMTSGEKDAVDASRLASAKATRKPELADEGDSYVEERYPNWKQLDALYIDSVRDRPNRAGYLLPYVKWREKVSAEVKAKQADVDAASTVTAVNAIALGTTTLDAADPEVTIADAIAETDDESLTSFLDANVKVTDPVTNISGAFWLMQLMMNRREIFNDTDNPLYDTATTPLIGEGGSVTNLNDIHDKLGWHRQEIFQQGWRQPKDLLIYYGWLNSFNSSELGWDNEEVAQALARYDVLVFGDGLQNPAHGDYSNTSVIIPRIKALNPCAKIFGYVSVNQGLTDFQTKTDQWNTLGVHGIFMDEAGYDFGTTTTNSRSAFNTKVDYVHGRSSANLCFANAWNTDHVLGTANDASYPNSTWNPTPDESNLTEDDWILLESLAINTTAYSGNDGYAAVADWAARISKMISLRATYGVNFAAAGVIANSDADAQELFDFSFVSALMGPCEAHGTSDTSYGASSSAVTYWRRPDTSDLDNLWSVNACVQVDSSDADVYHRYIENAKLSLDFSSGAQLSEISRNTEQWGDWNDSLNFATDYQAAVSGMVIAGFNGGLSANDSAYMQGKTDGATTPTTIRATCGADEKGGIQYNSFTMPVRKGDYWRVDRSGTEGTQFLHWIPLM